MTRADIRGFLLALAEARPSAETELLYTDPYTLLVAVVLSAQATDASVNKATPALFAEAPDPAAMVRLGADGVGRHIRSIGLWQGKRAAWSHSRPSCWPTMAAACRTTARR